MQLTTRDAARLLGVSDAQLEKWVRSGELNATRVNDQYRLNRIDLLEFATARNLDISGELLAELETDAPELPSLADAVRAGGVHRGIAGADKATILRAVVDRLPLGRPSDRELLFRVLLAREALGSTGYGDGIAIPHARNPIVLRVQAPEVAVCYLDQPVEFGAIDGKPVHTLITLVSPSTRAHLHLIALVAAALHDQAVLARLGERAGADTLVPEIARVERAIAARRAGAAS
jgi:nitrogen PTS system EIIA component